MEEHSQDDMVQETASAAERRRAPTWKRLGPVGVLGILWTALPAVAGFYLLARIDPVSQWLLTHGDMAVVVYAVCFIVLAGFGLLPTYAQAVLGGWVFGVALGVPAALAGFTGAALIGYVLTRFVSRDKVEREIDAHPKAKLIRDALLEQSPRRTLALIVLLRLPPNSPFALTNLALASSGVPIKLFTLGTMIGMLPRTAVVVAFAAAASATGAKSIQDFVKDGPGPWLFGAGVLLMVVALAVIGRIANKAVERQVSR